jgi:hypothetical protein
MCLDWKGNAAALSSRPWLLPNGSSLTGPAPVRFGIEIHRRSWDGYAVRLVWNETCFEWSNLMRKQLLNCCFGAILAAGHGYRPALSPRSAGAARGNREPESRLNRVAHGEWRRRNAAGRYAAG